MLPNTLKRIPSTSSRMVVWAKYRNRDAEEKIIPTRQKNDIPVGYKNPKLSKTHKLVLHHYMV